jgi:hypothetical protein
MKYIKKFEHVKNMPEIGDYIIVECNNTMGKSYDDIFNFLNNSVGKVVGFGKVGIFNDGVKIKFYNVPKNLNNYFNPNHINIFDLRNIVAFGKDKDDLIIQKKAREYNL